MHEEYLSAKSTNPLHTITHPRCKPIKCDDKWQQQQHEWPATFNYNANDIFRMNCTHALDMRCKTIFVYQARWRINSSPSCCHVRLSNSIWLRSVNAYACVRQYWRRMITLGRLKEKKYRAFFIRRRQNLIDITDPNMFNLKSQTHGKLYKSHHVTAFCIHTKWVEWIWWIFLPSKIT